MESTVAEDASPQDSIAGGAAAPDTIGLDFFPDPESPDVIIEEYLTEDKGVCFLFVYWHAHSHTRCMYYRSIYSGELVSISL